MYLEQQYLGYYTTNQTIQYETVNTKYRSQMTHYSFRSNGQGNIFHNQLITLEGHKNYIVSVAVQVYWSTGY